MVSLQIFVLALAIAGYNANVVEAGDISHPGLLPESDLPTIEHIPGVDVADDTVHAYYALPEFGHYPAVIAPEFGHFPADISPEFGHLPANVAPEFGHLPANVAPEFGHLPANVAPEFGHLPINVAPEFGHLPANVAPEFGHLPINVGPEFGHLPGNVDPEFGHLPANVAPEFGHLPINVAPEFGHLPGNVGSESKTPESDVLPEIKVPAPACAGYLRSLLTTILAKLPSDEPSLETEHLPGEGSVPEEKVPEDLPVQLPSAPSARNPCLACFQHIQLMVERINSYNSITTF